MARVHPDRRHRLTSHVSRLRLFLSLLTLWVAPLTAQALPDLEQERTAFATWLANAPDSPLATVAQQLIGEGLTLGTAESDIQLSGVAASRVVQEGNRVFLEQDGSRRLLARGRLTDLGAYRLRANGPASRGTLSVFGPHTRSLTPTYFPATPRFIIAGPLVPARSRVSHRILGVDGLETEVVEAGVFTVSRGSSVTALRVYRVTDEDTGESDLLIYFRDATSGKGSYPAGRFVTLLPGPDSEYVLDLNRARNPFCAYSSAYACPAPWPGNTLPMAVTAGERYEH